MPLQSQSIIPPLSDAMLMETQGNPMDSTDQNTMMISAENLDFSFDEKKPDMDKQSPLEMQTRSVQPLQEETPMDLVTHEAPSVDQLYVPPQFAPVKFDFMVNDAKYTQGGKFTYTPTTEDQQMINKKHRKSEDYRPDYVPPIRTKKNKKGNINSRRKSSKLILETIHKENKSLTVPCTHDTDEALGDTKEKTSHNHGVIIDDAITSRGIQSDNESTRSENSQLPEEGPSKTKRIINALQQAQERYIQQLICLKPLVRQKSLRLEQLVMDYDSPFAQAVVSNTIRPNRNFLDDESEEDRFRALDHLCQQAVMGGYPFSGGIEAMSSNGFEANEGESAKVVIARRRNLLQKLNGDAIHLPSTPNDVDFMIQHFKDILGEVFHYQQQQKKQTDTIDPMCLDQLPMPSSVTVKGPLSVQQCYDLSEANQAHSKYGKYQVKKRRPAEPNLDTLQPPTITVNRQEESLEGSSRLIMFWEKLRLEPYSSKKHVAYFVLYPKNESVEAHVTHFFRGLSTLYETCQLGAHLPGNTHTYRKGLVPVPLLAAQHPNESIEDRQLRSYMAECQQLGSSLSSMMNENIHIVIYLINPITHLKSHLDLSLCFHKLMDTYQTSIAQHMHKAPHKTPARLVLQLMPIEHVLRSTAFGGCLKFGLKEIAFAVYSKCHTIVHRPPNDPKLSIASMDIYSPPFVLSKPVPTQIPFKLKKAIHAFPTLLEDHPVLHMAYSFSFDRKWMVIVWTDNYGELIEFALLDRRQYKHLIFKEAWYRTKQVSKRTGSTWTFVIAKMGLLFEDELKAWMTCFQKKSEEEQDNGLGDEERVAIVSIDIESTFHVNVAAYASRLHELNSGDISATTTPTGNSTTSSTASPISTVPLKKMMDDQGQTKALLLNHRVAYSNRRERMSFGMLNMNPISHIEDWMIPLASGYIIHTPPTTENPNNELFNCDPVVLEIHLIYNQTNHSAYSTLRDIIKKYHALSYINVMPSDSNCFPIHIALVERLCRLLLVVHS
ncbi:mediator complex subunit 13 C-terminal-domain-containing protein [Choanephora cucurbitarum]|nr:mediator complex subunit 13 C-terminal-domain-containing protein [Choanephora cucurbitarum]